MHEAAAAVCGASLTAARAVWRGSRPGVRRGGGLHHGLATRASGFCIYNDCAVAIQALLDEGAERVACIDIDVHHGDGTQWIFFEDPRVMTASVHESGRYLFPGTGGIVERGIGSAEGTAVNVPLPPYAGDRPYLRAIEEVILPAVMRFKPDVIVTQDGADPHHADPLAHLQVTMDAFPRVYRMLHLRPGAAVAAGWLWAAAATRSSGAARLDDAYAEMIGASWTTNPRALESRGRAVVGARCRERGPRTTSRRALDERRRARVTRPGVDERAHCLGV